jgi:FKBP-type peptidyl-prolyl cis-trans isomerase SlyD
LLAKPLPSTKAKVPKLTVLPVPTVKADSVVIDHNHPLAGKTLHFDVTVREVRAATPEEVAHGHAHGPDGHHHHD